MGCASSCVPHAAVGANPLAGAGRGLADPQPLILLVRRGEGGSNTVETYPQARFGFVVKQPVMKLRLATFDRLEEVEEPSPINLRTLFIEAEAASPAGLRAPRPHPQVQALTFYVPGLGAPRVNGPASQPPGVLKVVAAPRLPDRWAEPRPPHSLSRVARVLPPEGAASPRLYGI